METLLHAATRTGNVEEVRRMLMRGVDPNKPDVDLYTPLHVACDRKDAACVEVLLKAKADPNVSHPGLDGWTPLHIAAWRDDSACAALLVAAGADGKAMDWYGQTPLARATGDVRVIIEAGKAAAGCNDTPAESGEEKQKDTWAGLRAPCSMAPSAVHLANIERCLQAATEHGTKQGDVCEHFDKDLVAGA